MAGAVTGWSGPVGRGLQGVRQAAFSTPTATETAAIRTAHPVSPRSVYNKIAAVDTKTGKLAALEQEGLIAQPHTSAGRIPTDKGYRAFVDRIDEIKLLSAAEKRAVARVLEHPVDVDDILDRTVRLLSQLTVRLG